MQPLYIFNSLVSSEIKTRLRGVNLPIGSNYRLQSMLYSQKHFFSSIQHNCTYTDVNFKNAVVGSCVKDKTTSNLMPPLPGGIWRPVIILYLEFYLFGDEKISRMAFTHFHSIFLLIGILHFGNQKFQTNQTSNVTLVEKRFDVLNDNGVDVPFLGFVMLFKIDLSTTLSLSTLRLIHQFKCVNLF